MNDLIAEYTASIPKIVILIILVAWLLMRYGPLAIRAVTEWGSFLSAYNREKLQLELAKLRYEVEALRQKFPDVPVGDLLTPPPTRLDWEPVGKFAPRWQRALASLAAVFFAGLALRFAPLQHVIEMQDTTLWTIAAHVFGLTIFLLACWLVSLTLIKKAHSAPTAALFGVMTTVLLHALLPDFLDPVAVLAG